MGFSSAPRILMEMNTHPYFSPLLMANEGEYQPGKDKEDCYEHRLIADKRPLGLVPQVVEFQELHVAMCCEKGLNQRPHQARYPCFSYEIMKGQDLTVESTVNNKPTLQ